MRYADEHNSNPFLVVAGWLLIAVIVIGFAFRFSLKMGVVHRFVQKKIVEIANEQLNAALTLNHLTGDLWNHARLTGLLLADRDTLISIDTLNLRYSLLSLTKDVFQIHEVSLLGVKANIVEEDSAQFNLQKLLKPRPETASAGTPFYLNISKLHVRDFNTSMFSPTYLPDKNLQIRGLNLDAGLRLTQSVSVVLNNLAFSVKEGRLPDMIYIKTSGDYGDDRITLKELVLETGRSLLSAHAFADTETEEISGELRVSPFSTADLIPYFETALPDENLSVQVSADGTRDSLTIGLYVQSPSLARGEISASLSFRESPTLTGLSIEMDDFDASGFTKQAVPSGIKSLQFTAEGEISSRLPDAIMNWTLRMEKTRYGNVHINRLSGNGRLEDGNLAGALSFSSAGGGVLNLEPRVQDIFGELPEWNLQIAAANLNPADWADSLDFRTNLTFAGAVHGKGFALSDQKFSYGLKADSELNSVGDIPVQQIEISGTIDEQTLTFAGGIKSGRSEIQLAADARSYMNDVPEYSFSLLTKNLDIAGFIKNKQLSTSLNLSLEGAGSGLNPETMALDGAISLESGFINRAEIEKADSRFNLKDGVLTFTDGVLLSQIADANLSLRQNLFDIADTENKLLFDISIKNPQPLAPLFGAEVLQATGNVSGTVTKNTVGNLMYKIKLQIGGIRMDDNVLIESVSGTADAVISEAQDVELSLTLERLLLYGAFMQEIDLKASSRLAEELISGDYTFVVTGNERGEMRQQGNFEGSLAANAFTLQLSQFDLVSTQGVLGIRQPFRLTYGGGVFKTDTLNLAADDGTFFSLYLPYADSTDFEMQLRGNNFDIGLIQDVLLDERFADGILSGSLNMEKKRGEIGADGEISLEKLNYKNTVADLLSLKFGIADERLIANGSVILNNRQIMNGSLDVPFIPAESTTLPESFFEQPVAGQLQIYSTELSDFKSALDAFGIANTSGILSFNGSLTGTAGRPDMGGRLSLAQPVLSGISMDSVFIGFDYNHKNNRLQFVSEISAAKQKAVTASVEIPFSYDFKNFRVAAPPSGERTVAVIKTDDFNMAALNDFLDKKYTRNLKGLLNGSLTLEGIDRDFTVAGTLNLTKASLEVPVANITLNEIRSALAFRKDGIHIEQLSAKSGPGDFSASGLIKLDGLTPSGLELNAAARQFRLINTKDYNMTIDLDSKLSGPATAPKATGKLTIKNGFVYLQDFGDKYVEDVRLEGEEEGFSPYDSLAIEMQFEIERNFFVRNRRYLDMEVELTGSLDAVKETGGELSLFGNLEGVKGYVKPLGKFFNLDEANLAFSGPLNDPDFYIKSSYKPNQNQDPVTLYYVIEGTGTKPQFRFESDPPMEQQDIISYTLFGRPFYALDSWQRTISGSNSGGASDILVEILLDEVESLATRELGIDVVQIESIRSGTETGTSIKTGWYINNRTFFAIVNEISSSNPKTLFLLEYMLSKNVDLILTQGDNARQGIDIRWKKDY